MLIDIVIFLLIGVFAGVMSGMLGVGGGIIVVPALAFVFMREQFPSDLIMHIAAGTSLASMVVTTSIALKGHTRHHIKFWPLYERLFGGIVVGIIGGAILAHFLHSDTLSIIFGIVTMVMGIKMLLPKHKHSNKNSALPSSVVCSSVGGILGVFSGLLGVGAGSLSIPILTYLGITMRQAVVVSCALGVTIGIMGSFSFMITGLHSMDLPSWSTGYVYWPAVLGISVGSMVCTPLGVKISHYLSSLVLQRVFAVFLLMVGLHMLYVVWL